MQYLTGRKVHMITDLNFLLVQIVNIMHTVSDVMNNKIDDIKSRASERAIYSLINTFNRPVI